MRLIRFSVPIFDGRAHPFTLSSYQMLQRHGEELPINSVAMVTFTVGGYELPREKVPDGAILGMDMRVSFNIKSVVFLADSTIPYSSRIPMGEDSWGVEPQAKTGWGIGLTSGNNDVSEESGDGDVREEQVI